MAAIGVVDSTCSPHDDRRTWSMLSMWTTHAAALTAALHAAPGGIARAGPPEHLLICEAVLTPTSAEYVEIVNLGPRAVDLSRYHLADSTFYWHVPIGQILPTLSDFMAKFPDGASIAPGQVIAVSLSVADGGYFATYGKQPDFALAPTKASPPGLAGPVPLMMEAYLGSIGPGHSLADAGEAVHLFFWDGQSDLVQDVDVVRFGTPTSANNVTNKSGISVDGPDADGNESAYFPDALTMPVMQMFAAAGLSHKRLTIEGDDEVAQGGNGITGHDETTENIGLTFDGSGTSLTAPTPGVCDLNVIELCAADVAPPPKGDGLVNVDDLLLVIGEWGPCQITACEADITGDGTVNVDDLLTVIGEWGPCT